MYVGQGFGHLDWRSCISSFVTTILARDLLRCASCAGSRKVVASGFRLCARNARSQSTGRISTLPRPTVVAVPLQCSFCGDSVLLMMSGMQGALSPGKSRVCEKCNAPLLKGLLHRGHRITKIYSISAMLKLALAVVGAVVRCRCS